MPDPAGFWDALEVLHFLRPLWLIALFPVALLVWLQRRSEDLVARFSDVIAPHLLEHLVVRPDRGRRRVRPVDLVALALGVAIVGAAGPTWRRQPSPFAADTAPVMVALDLSQSMDAIDVAPSRLERAKQKIRDLLDGRSGAKTGLVVYAGSAHLVLPPTQDTDVFTTFLDSLATDLMPVPGSDASAAVERAFASLDRQDVPGTVILTTATVDTDLDALAARLASSPHQLLALAVGTEEGGPIRRGEDSFVTDGGRRVMSRLDPAQFAALNDATGAYYTRATVEDTDVRRLLTRTNSHLESALGQDSTQDWEDAGYWLAWPATLLALCWFRRGWTVRWSQVLAASLAAGVLVTFPAAQPLGAQDTAASQAASEAAAAAGDSTDASAATRTAALSDGWTDLWWTRDQQGRRLFEAGDFATAAATFEDPAWRGVAAYRAGNWDLAIDSFAAVPGPEGSFNLGNAYFKKADYGQAVAAYEQALADRPDWADAAANRELAQSLIPPPPDEEQGQGEPTFKADQFEFDLDEDKGSEGEVQMQAFTDEQMADMWLNQLTTSPAGFLRTKFAIQVAQSAPAPASEGDR